jgi:hypothetical protein
LIEFGILLCILIDNCKTEDDDKEWLQVSCYYHRYIFRSSRNVIWTHTNGFGRNSQFWMLGGVLFMLTTWVDDVIQTETANAVWLGSLLFIFFWLYFPLTCGALLVYDNITEPFLGPRLKPLQKQMSNFILAVYQTLANATHLYLVWIIFMFLPAGFKRVVAIAIGTVYPFVCSVTAAATEDIEDDTVSLWATYLS